MKKFIAILSVLFAFMAMSYTADAQSSFDYVQTKEIEESCTIVKEVTYINIEALGLDGPVKAGRTVKAKIEWKYYGSCRLSIITSDGEDVQVERWSGDNLKFRRLKSADGHYSYGLGNDDFLFFTLVWSPYMKFDDGDYINEGYILIVKTRELD